MSPHAWLPAMLLALAGCAGPDTPPPKAELASAELAVRQAVTADAREYAPLPLHEAQESLARAQAAMGAERYVIARRHAEQASVNAQLALAETQAARAEQLAEENRRTVDTLREEVQRQQQQSRAAEEAIQ